MLNLMQQGLAVQQEIVDANNVIPFPSFERAKELHAQGKVVVHKPEELRKFVERTDDDFFGGDAA